MFAKSSVLMMLLLMAASLVGISSIYKPANVETQPIQPTQPAQPAQPAQPLQRQQLGTMLRDIQSQEDKKLVDRLFPHIIKKIDGATLLQKIDARTLAAKVLPYLDLNIAVFEGPARKTEVKFGGALHDLGPYKRVLSEVVSCPPDWAMVSGGFRMNTFAPVEVWDNAKVVGDPNKWRASVRFSNDGDLQVVPYCLRAELGLKQVEQPAQPIITPPPGGPPLRPPTP